MGTKAQNLPGYCSMRDLNEESSSCGWPLLYGDKTLTNGQYYNNYLPSSSADTCSYDKDCVKRMMLEHEAIFKNQVYELHRLYRIQRDLMNEVERNELRKNQIPVEASYSVGPLASQITTEDGQKWHISGFPMGNSPCAKTSISGVEGNHSPLGSIKGISKQTDLFPSPNGCSSKDVEVLESRPSKVRRKTFDLHLLADEYIDPEESEKRSDEKISGQTLFLPDRSCNNAKEGDEKVFCGNGGKIVSLVETSKSEQSARRNGLVDLNEPLQVEEINDSPCLLSCNSCQGATECSDLSAARHKSEFFGLSGENFSHHGTDSWARNNQYLENSGSGKGRISSVAEPGQVNRNLQSVPQVLKLEKSLFSSQTLQDSHSNADLWRERAINASDIGERKIFGVPIFDVPHISPKKEFSSITSPSALVPNSCGIETVENSRRTQIFDINLPCDAIDLELDKEEVTETLVNKERSPATEASSRILIDLNLSMSDDEEPLTTIPNTNEKTKTLIDLEAPASPETEEDPEPEEKQLETSPVSPQGPQCTAEQPQDELIRNAAEAIVVMSSLPCDQVDGMISSSSESPMEDPLSWFVDVISSSCKDNLERKRDTSREKDGERNEECSSEGMDYFESMTLKLPETKEEDYMPKPIVPENFKVEETSPLLPTRGRKGPARRGRQRRDFQRDILPGLASLSRHEVTEDLQIFGGLMRATSHSWNSGSTRRSSSRNGGGRGRRKVQVVPSPPQPAPANDTCTTLIQQLNIIEVGLEDRSLTGWGKTTRRPRRQRCPAGNPLHGRDVVSMEEEEKQSNLKGTALPLTTTTVVFRSGPITLPKPESKA